MGSYEHSYPNLISLPSPGEHCLWTILKSNQSNTGTDCRKDRNTGSSEAPGPTDDSSTPQTTESSVAEGLNERAAH